MTMLWICRWYPGSMDFLGSAHNGTVSLLSTDAVSRTIASSSSCCPTRRRRSGTVASVDSSRWQHCSGGGPTSASIGWRGSICSCTSTTADVTVQRPRRLSRYVSLGHLTRYPSHSSSHSSSHASLNSSLNSSLWFTPLIHLLHKQQKCVILLNIDSVFL